MISSISWMMTYLRLLMKEIILTLSQRDIISDVVFSASCFWGFYFGCKNNQKIIAKDRVTKIFKCNRLLQMLYQVRGSDTNLFIAVFQVYSIFIIVRLPLKYGIMLSSHLMQTVHRLEFGCEAGTTQCQKTLINDTHKMSEYHAHNGISFILVCSLSCLCCDKITNLCN